MQYAKMDLAKFTENVKGGRYESRTAARRAAGKADWSDKDRDAAHVLINKTWGDDAPTKPKRGKTAKPAKRAAKETGKVTPATLSAPTSKPAKRAPRAQSSAQGAPALHSIAGDNILRRAPVTLGAQEPVSTSRMVASAGVIQAYKNVTPLTPIEKLAYDVAVAEFTVNESDDARAVRLGQRGVPETPPEPKRNPPAKQTPPARKPTSNGTAEAAQSAPTISASATNARPHIAVPTPATTPAVESESAADIDEDKLTPDQKAQLARVRQAVATMPDLGPTIPPVSVTAPTG
jgi:hypothetical protein